MKLTTVIASATLAVAPCAGCREPSQSLPSLDDDGVAALIGGVAADSAALDAVGALVLVRSVRDCASGKLDIETTPVCTATLVAPQTVITAKHCVEQALTQQEPGMELIFAIGPNRAAPRRRVPVIGWELGETFSGGWTKTGHDVAALLLGERVADVAPIEVAAPRAELVGRRLAAIGYGAQNNSRQSGTRLAGNVTLNALEGKTYASMFDSDFAAFRSWYLDEDPTAPAALGSVGLRPGQPSERELREIYDSTLLLPGYEAHAGARPGDAQPCFGDSGGPLIAIVAGKLVSYGVASGGVRSVSMICDGGSVYATFGPDNLALIERARSFRDPCAGLPMRGLCEGAIARRCTSALEGPRRIVSIDCAGIGEVCGKDDEGRAVCVDPSEKNATSSGNSRNQCPDTP